MAADGNDLETVLLDIATAAAGLFDAPIAVVFVAEGNEIGLYAHARSDSGDESSTRSRREHSESSALTEVLRDRRVLLFDDQSVLGDEYTTAREQAIRLGLKSAVYVPMPSGRFPLGIVVFKRVVEPFTDKDVTLLQAFATQAANAVESARRAEELAASNYTAIGTVVNLAARLCGQAQGGEVLATERVVAPLADAAVTESAGSIELKGMATPVAVHRVAGTRGRPGMATVPAGMLTVKGLGTGFEATIVVSVFVAGQPGPTQL